MNLSDYSFGGMASHAIVAVAACGLNACIFASDPTAGEEQVAEDTEVMQDTTADGGMPDGGSPDGGGEDTGLGVPPTDLYYFSSGGGEASSGSYQMKASFGAPAPRDEASSSNYRIQLAPVSP